MATTIILLTKKDIETIKVGNHYQINISDSLSINFTQEAIDELINDCNSIKQDLVAEPMPIEDGTYQRRG